MGVKTRDATRLGNVARALCDDPQVHVSRWMEYQCFHGLGHGLMITTGYGLPISLEACERVQTFLDRTSCKGGVFMENITSSYGFRSSWLRDDDPVYPCNVVDADDKITCYGMVTSRVLRVIGLDWEQTRRDLLGVESDYVVTCSRSLGRDISGQTRRDPEEIVELCAGHARVRGGGALHLGGGDGHGLELHERGGGRRALRGRAYLHAR